MCRDCMQIYSADQQVWESFLNGENNIRMPLRQPDTYHILLKKSVYWSIFYKYRLVYVILWRVVPVKRSIT